MRKITEQSGHYSQGVNMSEKFKGFAKVNRTRTQPQTQTQPQPQTQILAIKSRTYPKSLWEKKGLLKFERSSFFNMQINKAPDDAEITIIELENDWRIFLYHGIYLHSWGTFEECFNLPEVLELLENASQITSDCSDEIILSLGFIKVCSSFTKSSDNQPTPQPTLTPQPRKNLASLLKEKVMARPNENSLLSNTLKTKEGSSNAMDSFRRDQQASSTSESEVSQPDFEKDEVGTFGGDDYPNIADIKGQTEIHESTGFSSKQQPSPADNAQFIRRR